jgi:hypothetical protein
LNAATATEFRVYAQEIPESVKQMVEQDETRILAEKKPVAPEQGEPRIVIEVKKKANKATKSRLTATA